MNLLNPSYTKTAPGLLNTTPNYFQNSYSNFYKPGNFSLLQSTVVEPPVVETPMSEIYPYGNSPGDTMGNGLDPNNGTQNVEDMTTADLETGISQIGPASIGLGLMGVPAMGILGQLSKNAMENEIASRMAMGADGHGNNSMDPTAPGGIGGSAGSAAATGGGGFGPDMGGDGGFGL